MPTGSSCSTEAPSDTRQAVSGAYPGAMLALEFLVLTAARSGEVRNARWEHSDRAGAVWTIPARAHEGRPGAPGAALAPGARGARRRG